MILKTEKAFTVIGKKLEKEYKKLKFKYSRKKRYLKKSTKKYEYYIFFSSFYENIPGEYIELRVVFTINDRIALKTKTHSNSELFFMDLWKMGNHYNIANEILIDEAFGGLTKKIAEHFIPEIEKLEGQKAV